MRDRDLRTGLFDGGSVRAVAAVVRAVAAELTRDQPPVPRPGPADADLTGDLTHAVLTHYGYTGEQIAAAEQDPDHAATGCVPVADGSGCADEHGDPAHRDHDEVAATANLMVDVVVPHVNTVMADRFAALAE